MSTVTELRSRAQANAAEMRKAATSGNKADFERASERFEEANADLQRAVSRRDAELDELLGKSPGPAGGDFRNAADAGVYGRITAKYAPGRELNGHWDSFGSFVKDITPAAIRNKGVPAVFKAGLSEGVDTAGGFLVPAEHLSELLRLSAGREIVRPRAFVVPANSDALRIPRITETTRAAGSVHGGMSAEWAGEGVTLGNDDPTFGELPMTIFKLALRTTLSNELLADSSPAILTVLPELFADTMAFALDSAFLTTGDGATKPWGVLHSTNPALITVPRATASHVEWADVTAMFSRLLPESVGTAVWIASQSTIPDLFGMTVGTGENPVFIANGSASAPPTLLGLPLLFSEHLSALGTAGDLALVDFRKYVVADRAQLNVRVSEHEKFSDDKTVIRGILRIDGRPWMASALTPANGGSTLSAYIRLGDHV